MKFKKLTISIIIVLTIMSINTISSAKYVFEYTIKAAEIIISN